MFEELESVIESINKEYGLTNEDIAQEGLFTPKTDSQNIASMKKRYAIALSKAESKLRKKLKTIQDCISYKKSLSAEAVKYNQALQKLANAAKKLKSGKVTEKEIKPEIMPYITFLKTNSDTLMIKVLGGGVKLTNTSEDIKALGQYIKDLRKIVEKILSEIKGQPITESATTDEEVEETDKKNTSKGKKKDKNEDINEENIDDDADEDEDAKDETDDDSDDDKDKKCSKKKEKKCKDGCAEESAFIAACESMMIDTSEFELSDLFDELDSIAQESADSSSELDDIFNELEQVVQESAIDELDSLYEELDQIAQEVSTNIEEENHNDLFDELFNL